MTCYVNLCGSGILKSLSVGKRPVFYPKIDVTLKIEEVKIVIIEHILVLSNNNEHFYKKNKHILLEKDIYL